MAEKILTEAALEGYRVYTENIVSRKAKFRLTTGGWHDVNVLSLSRLPNNKIAIVVDVNPDVQGKATIAEVQLFDIHGNMWASTKEQVTVENVQVGVLWRFILNLVEYPIDPAS